MPAIIILGSDKSGLKYIPNFVEKIKYLDRNLYTRNTKIRPLQVKKKSIDVQFYFEFDKFCDCFHCRDIVQLVNPLTTPTSKNG